ncbi:protein adenylyltransferase SelO [Chitinivorax sp. B]|uniref:protein adenylyltransferase SelO n=1 Tax=Chitinivorax sp. B TaxID=2502235 RepID=UPI0010F7B29C|nr:YdiU family protein [Chitinivorax sp. B]
MTHTLDNLNFTNRFARLPDVFYTRLAPTPLPAPYPVAFSQAAATLIDLSAKQFHDPQFADYLAGNLPLPGQDTLAALYAGHQFGHYVSQLGDGRAIWLGEVQNAQGDYWELQLKGAGETPYSRMGDGRAVLRSSIREFLCSEAMYGLGIPTTRALSIVGSDEPVYRETPETAAVILRMSPSFIRFGSFEVFFYRNQHDQIKQLADFVIHHYYPACKEAPNPYQAFLEAVIARTADLMADWQAVGFCHGVMNTDNMSILGLTLDYGPFGFLDAFDAGHICNHSDHSGRYAYDQQPAVALWNLHCLAQAMITLLDRDEAIEALRQFQPHYETAYLERMGRKLGLDTWRDEDDALLVDLLNLMQTHQIDYTIFFRKLCEFDPVATRHPIRDECLDRDAIDAWLARYAARLLQTSQATADRQAQMRRVNPKYVLRNHLAEIAIQAATRDRDYSEIDRLLNILIAPYDEHPGFEHYADYPPPWAQTLSVSCSS